MPVPYIPAKSLVVLALKPRTDENRSGFARARAAFCVAAERCLGI